MSDLGRPRLHLAVTDSTNRTARDLAAGGAPHGTLVTAAAQTAGRGRQGRSWTAPAGRSLLASLVVRPPSRLLSLAAGLAVARVAESLDAAGREAAVKWPNDVLLDGRKVAGILVEGRPQDGWMVLGIGVNVALRDGDLDDGLADRATGLGRGPGDVETVLTQLLGSLSEVLEAGEDVVLAALRERDALRDRPVRWADGEGIAAGIDGQGRLLVDSPEGRVALSAGEVHLQPAGRS